MHPVAVLFYFWHFFPFWDKMSHCSKVLVMCDKTLGLFSLRAVVTRDRTLGRFSTVFQTFQYASVYLWHVLIFRVLGTI